MSPTKRSLQAVLPFALTDLVWLRNSAFDGCLNLTFHPRSGALGQVVDLENA